MPRRLAPPVGPFVVLLAALVGCGGGKKGAGGFQPPPVSVEVAVARKGAVEERLSALGTVEAAESVRVATEVDALVVELPFQEGTLVQKGQVLARLNDSEPRAELQRAEALREQARLAFDRLSELAARSISPPQDRDNAEASLKVADANVAVARARLVKTRIVAPFSGVLGRRLVSPGAFLRTGDAVTELARVDEVKLAFSVPERHLAALRRGAKVRVVTVAHAGKAYEGTVNLVEPILDAGTRTARAVALVPNREGDLRPGMSAEVSAVLEERADAVTVPDEAVFAEGDRNYVYVLSRESSVTRQAVELGARQPGTVEVVKGLSGGEKVVRAGHQKLYEGAKVSPVESAAEPGDVPGAAAATATP